MKKYFDTMGWGKAINLLAVTVVLLPFVLAVAWWLTVAAVAAVGVAFADVHQADIVQALYILAALTVLFPSKEKR